MLSTAQAEQCLAEAENPMTPRAHLASGSAIMLDCETLPSAKGSGLMGPDARTRKQEQNPRIDVRFGKQEVSPRAAKQTNRSLDLQSQRRVEGASSNLQAAKTAEVCLHGKVRATYT